MREPVELEVVCAAHAILERRHAPGGATQDLLPTSVDVFGTLGMIREVH